MRQPEIRPLVLTVKPIDALPRGIRPAEMRRYSLLGILPIIRAGVKPVKSPIPPPPRPMPVPPAPGPVPALAAPWLGALPVPATLAAGIGEGRGSFGCGATTGDGSAFLPAAPSSSLARSARRAGGGGSGGGGGGRRRSKVFRLSTAWVTMRPLSPVRMMAASAAWTAITAAMALAWSGRSGAAL
jgi:hypothetical protein